MNRQFTITIHSIVQLRCIEAAMYDMVSDRDKHSRRNKSIALVRHNINHDMHIPASPGHLMTVSKMSATPQTKENPQTTK